MGRLRTDIRDGFSRVEGSLNSKADRDDVNRLERQVDDLGTRVGRLESDGSQRRAIRASWHNILVVGGPTATIISTAAFVWELLHK